MEVRSLTWLIVQVLLFIQFPRYLAPISVVLSSVLPVSPGVDGSPRIIWNLSSSSQGTYGHLAVKKKTRAVTAMQHLLRYQRTKMRRHDIFMGVL